MLSDILLNYSNNYQYSNSTQRAFNMRKFKLKHYGNNTPDGEYYSIFLSIDEEYFPLGKRWVFKFAIIDKETNSPIHDEYDNPLFAVAVCNYSQMKSSKSKVVKVTRALLSKDYDVIQSLSEVPHPEELEMTKAFIRVQQRTSEKGKVVSNITHIKRPRDGEWECIESKFDTSIKRELTMEDIQRKFGFSKPE